LIRLITYLAGAGLIFLIHEPASSHTDRSHIKTDQSPRMQRVNFWKKWNGGLQLVLEHRTLSYAFLAVGVALIGDSIMGVLLVVFLQNIVGAGAQEFGWVLTARGIGGVVGGLVIARIAPRFQPRNLLAFGMASAGDLLVLMLRVPTLSVVLMTVILVGFPVMAMMIAGQTLLQTNTEDQAGAS
jgi:predicted MFS family arabinose efflux permease